MIGMWEFALLFIPLAILIGVAAASISFTAWNIVVPLAFVGLKFPVYDAIFLSIIIDLVDSLILTVIYAKNGRVDFKDGLKWALPTLIGAGIAYVFSEDFLTGNPDMLKGGVSYFVMIIGATFLIRGIKGIKKTKNTDISSPSESHGNKIKHLDNEEDKKKKTNLSKKWIVPAIVLGMGVSGALGGLVGMGSGTNFVVILLIFIPAYDLATATGTGAFLMFLLMALCAILFVGYIDISFLGVYLLISVTFSAIGTLIAAKFAVTLSKEKLNLAVGIVVLIAAIASSIQSIFL
ncbi:MAG: TSUP family transporter [Candidatus Lokiarchaeota archaeon]|nr:TSUP family transporter [Candidatus Lokiarchaeota archaeon]